jgi:ATP-binding cassette, subfamily B, multidrug efflux pump
MARNTYFEDEDLEQISGHTLRRLLAYFGPHKKRVTFALVLIAVSAGAALMGPFLVKIAVDNYLPVGNSRAVIMIGLAYVGVLAAGALSVGGRIKVMIPLGNQIIEQIRDEAFNHVQRLSFQFFDTRPAGKIIVRLMNNVDRLQMLFKHAIINILADVFRLLVIIGMMFQISGRLSLIALMVTPLMAVFVFLVKRTIRSRWELYQKKASNLNAYAHESFLGVKVTQSFVREKVNSHIMAEQLDDNYSSWMRAVNLSNTLFPAVLVFNTVAIGLVYLFGYRFLAQGIITLGTIIAFGQYVWMITEPIVNLSTFYNEILVSLAAGERVFDILDTPATVVDSEDAYPLPPPVRGKVEFEHVHFAYEEGVPIFRDLSLTVEPGQTIALVGETGAGKSTIINMISRFYDITSGRIFIDGHEIRDVTLESLRSQVGIMMQDSFIFSGTVADNIRYGNLNATQEEIEAAAQAVHAHPFIMEMEDGYQTQVNERGSRLSVGQKQLIAFARTLLFDPQILVLDEATSSIDTQTEIALQHAIQRVLVDRTSFVIAHRLSTIRNADRIVVIDKGTIVESGTHEELVAAGGHYAKLHEAQYAQVG